MLQQKLRSVVTAGRYISFRPWTRQVGTATTFGEKEKAAHNTRRILHFLFFGTHPISITLEDILQMKV